MSKGIDTGVRICGFVLLCLGAGAIAVWKGTLPLPKFLPFASLAPTAVKWVFLGLGAPAIFTGLAVQIPFVHGRVAPGIEAFLGELGWRQVVGWLWRLAMVVVALGAAAVLYKFFPYERYPPDLMLSRVTIPATTLAVSVAFAVLPRIAQINLAVLIGLIAAAEGGVRLYDTAALHFSDPSASKKPSIALSGGYRDKYFRNDALLGYRSDGYPRAATSKRMVDGTVIYDVLYTLNKLGWRKTSIPANEKREKFIAFFGGSYTFGEGVNDNETLPYYVNVLNQDYQSYNLGFHGYGPQHMLALLQFFDLPKSMIRQRRGLAIYSFKDWHIQRLIGAANIHNTWGHHMNTWGHHMPYYADDGDGKVVYKGNLTSGRPIVAALLPIAKESLLLRKLGFDSWPSPIEEKHVEWTATYFRAACDEFERQFESEGCYVLLLPGTRMPETGTAEPFRKAFAAAGVSIIDLSDAFLSDALKKEELEKMTIPGDKHPTPEGHRFVAERLVRALGLPLGS